MRNALTVLASAAALLLSCGAAMAQAFNWKKHDGQTSICY